MLARASDSGDATIDSIRGVIFFGIPNHGMKISHLLSMVHSQLIASPVALLLTDSSFLSELDQQLSRISVHYNIKIMSVHETKRSPTTKVRVHTLMCAFSIDSLVG